MIKTKTTKRPKPPASFDENPSWPSALIRNAKRASEVSPRIVEAAKRGPGRPALEKPKVLVSLRLEPDILQIYKSVGRGWQIKINQVLTQGAKKLTTANVSNKGAVVTMTLKQGEVFASKRLLADAEIVLRKAGYGIAEKRVGRRSRAPTHIAIFDKRKNKVCELNVAGGWVDNAVVESLIANAK